MSFCASVLDIGFLATRSVISFGPSGLPRSLIAA
jgi:hypothetical protein